MKHKSIFFSISLILSSFSLLAQELPKEVVWQKVEGVNVPIPPQTHPRLYVRSSDLPVLKERMKTPQAQQTLSLMKELGKDRTPDEEAAVTNRGFRYYYEMRGVTTRVQLQALDYLWMVINAWLVGLLPPCSTHCNVPVLALVPICQGPVGLC